MAPAAGPAAAEPRAPLGAAARAVLAGTLTAAAALAADYVLRTSVVADGVRTFLLWDDGMISMQYAKNLAAGHGLVWSVGGEPVQGFSNPAVTLFMAGLHRLPLAPERMAGAVQAVNALLLAGITLATCAWMRTGLGAAPAVAVTAAVGAAFCLPLFVYALQGSDTGFVCLWLLLCQLLLLRSAARGGGLPPLLAPLLALGIWLRLDSAIFLLPLGLVALGLPGLRLRQVVIAAAVVAAAVAALLAFGWLYYGDPLPNTWYLKATGQPRGLMLQQGWLQLRHWLPAWAPLGLLAAWGAVREWRRPAARLAVGCIAVALGYHLWVGGDLQPRIGSRFWIPVLPLFGGLGVAGAAALAAALPARVPARGRTALAVAASVAALAWSSSGAPLREVVDRDADTLLKAYNRQNLASARFYRDHTRPHTTIALHWAGVIAYFSERPVVDVLGKSDRHIARLEVDRFSPGHSKWDWDYVVTVLQPDIVNAESRGLLQHPEFRRRYARADPPNAPYFYIRRDRLRRVTARDVRFTRLDLVAPDG